MDEKNEFQEQVDKKERWKLDAQRRKKQSIWYGFSMFGLIGWSVAVPTVLFVLFGIWLDNHYGGERSYTLALLLAGLIIGCLNAWYWVEKKMKEIQEESPNDEHNE